MHTTTTNHAATVVFQALRTGHFAIVKVQSTTPVLDDVGNVLQAGTTVSGGIFAAIKLHQLVLARKGLPTTNLVVADYGHPDFQWGLL